MIENVSVGEIDVVDRETPYRWIAVPRFGIGNDHSHPIFGHLIPHLLKRGYFALNHREYFDQKENVSYPFVHEFSDA
jgi:hypothetical protein